jgi:RNA polymerase sigma-70 factor, ECF subfamily
MDLKAMVDHRPTVGPAPLRTEAPPSFAQIYRKYAPQVVRWAKRLGGPDCDAEDVVQEVFLVVSRKLDGGRDENHLVSWLFEITRKIAANHRRRLRWHRLWTSGDDLARLRAEGAQPDAALESRRVVTLFYRALHQLSEKHQTVFVLYELEGQSILAIAELTQRNPSTVKVQLARARARFISNYQRLLRRDCADSGTGLVKLAQRVVTQDAPPPIARLGKKTS